MTYKCLKAVAFCFCWGFRKAELESENAAFFFLVLAESGETGEEN